VIRAADRIRRIRGLAESRRALDDNTSNFIAVEAHQACIDDAD
jgi:hypothetical protein